MTIHMKLIDGKLEEQQDEKEQRRKYKVVRYLEQIARLFFVK